MRDARGSARARQDERAHVQERLWPHEANHRTHQRPSTRHEGAGLRRTTMKKHADSARTLDIITREVGMLELEDPKVTKEDRRWAEGVVAGMNARIAEYRRDRLPKTAPPIK